MSYKKYGDLAPTSEEEKVISDNSPHILHVTSLEQKRHLIERNAICVVDIWGSWCAPCKALNGPYTRMAEKYGTPGKIAFLKEDVTLELSPSVKAVPTIHFYVKGKIVDTVTGPDVKAIEAKVNELLGNL